MKFKDLFNKLYINKKDAVIMALIVSIFMIVSYLIVSIASIKVGMVTMLSLMLILILFFIGYLYRKHLALSVYDLNDAHNYKQIESIFGLYDLFKFDYPLPPMRHWAISPDALMHIVRLVLKNKPTNIVECGSGVSTIVIAKCMKKLGAGHVWSLDNDEDYANKTRDLLELNDLSDFATVITSPLENMPIDGKDYKWYSLEGVSRIPVDIDLLFVDGPPAPQGTMSRFPAVPVLKNKFSKDITIIMDDYIRDDEKKIAKLWADDLDKKIIQEIDVEKGMAIL